MLLKLNFHIFEVVSAQNSLGAAPMVAKTLKMVRQCHAMVKNNQFF